MNDLTSQQSTSLSHRRRWLLVLVSVPIVLVAIALAVLAFIEYRSSRRVAAEITRLRAAGEPVDNQSMASWFLANTSQEGTVAWREILVAVDHITARASANSLPIVGTGELPDDLVPGGEWADEPRIAEFLKEVQPLLAQIEQAARYPTPVWQPIAFDSFQTLLPDIQSSRSVIRLCQLEFRHALYHQDTERIARSLAAMQATAAAFEWDMCMISDLVGIALRGIHRDSIRQALTLDGWQLSDIDQLLAQVSQPRDVTARWQRIVAGERGMTLALLQGDPRTREEMLTQEHAGAAAWLLLPSATERYLDQMAAMQQLADDGVVGLSDRAQAFESQSLSSAKGRFEDVLIRLFQPAIEGMARAYERDELDRRLTRTAVAIKRYQLVEGHWPAQLSDLTTMGLEARDWTALQAGPFGYRIEGDDAVLWAYDDASRYDVPARIPDQPPERDSADPQASFWYVVRIP
jgi:hypothetical protein